MNSSWIDVSVPIRHGMVHWPGNPAVTVELVKNIAMGGSSNVSRLSLGVHTGTHVDAPLHFIQHGGGVETIPFDALLGPARVVAVSNDVEVTVSELESARIQAEERILLRTRNSEFAWTAETFVDNAVHLSVEAAVWLAAHSVKTVGIDYLSVGGYRAKNGTRVHDALFGAGILIIEGLDLSAAPAGDYEMICLPLRIDGCDGAPARVLLRPR